MIRNCISKTVYQKQGNALVINILPINQGILTEFETEERYKTVRQLGIAKGIARKTDCHIYLQRCCFLEFPSGLGKNPDSRRYHCSIKGGNTGR